MAPPIAQHFRNPKGRLLATLPTHVDEDTHDRFVLWSGILDRLDRLNDVRYIQDDANKRVFFDADSYYRLYVSFYENYMAQHEMRHTTATSCFVENVHYKLSIQKFRMF